MLLYSINLDKKITEKAQYILHCKLTISQKCSIELGFA